MSLHGTQNKVGANILKRMLGSETSMNEEFYSRSFLFEGHDMRMRYHEKRVEIGQREEDKRLAVIRKEQKRLARIRASERRAEKKRLETLEGERSCQ